MFYQFIVSKVDTSLQDAAQAGGHCDPQVELVGFVVRDIFSFLRPNKSGQEHMSGVDLAHCISIDKIPIYCSMILKLLTCIPEWPKERQTEDSVGEEEAEHLPLGPGISPLVLLH